MNRKIEKAIDEMKIELRVRNYSLKTQKSYLMCCRRYLEYRGNLDLDECELKRFLVGLQDKGLSPQTINLYLNAVSQCLKMGENSGLIQSGPLISTS